MYGIMIWQWQWEALGDPQDRDRRGLGQYEGRSRRYWVLWLIVSPWHIYRYRMHMRRDPAPDELEGRP